METYADRVTARSPSRTRRWAALLAAALVGSLMMAVQPTASASDAWISEPEEDYYRFTVPHDVVLEATDGQEPTGLVAEGNFIDGSTTGWWELGREGEVWQTTRGPVEPGLYVFRYLALLPDGSRIPVSDPSDPSGVTSDPDVQTLFVPGESAGWLSDVADGGAVETLSYGSEGVASVWTPAGYDADRSQPYPVLFLQPGEGGDGNDWVHLGRAPQILDNLDAAGDLEPMVVVMGDGDLDGLGAAVEADYNVSTDGDDRAIAGIGQGADQALEAVVDAPGSFSHVGLFSALSGLPAGADAAAINAGTDLLRVYVGNSNDDAYNPTYELLQELDQAGIDHQFDGVNPEAGDAWETWQESLHDLAPRLFSGGGNGGLSEGHRELTEPHELPAPGTTPTPWIDEHGMVTFETTTEFADATTVTVWANLSPGGSWVLIPLEQDGDRWRGTVGPLDPWFYYYRLIVDGVDHRDESNPVQMTTEPNWTPFLVPGDEARMVIDVPEGEGGEVELLTYDSDVANQERAAYVWTPPGYDADRSQGYPVFFLQHGGGQSYTDWLEVGRAKQILDNHHRDGNLADMVVVMGNGNVSNFQAELLDNLRPAVQDAYNVSDQPVHQALAGLSFGGFHTMNTVLNHPGEFAYIGAFAAFLFGAPPQVDVDAINEGTKMLRLYTGDITDFTYPNVMQLRDTLTNLGVEHEFDGITVGPHGWDTWQKNLIDFAPRLFTPRTKDECKEGGWQEFSAGHGFRNQGHCVSYVARRQ